MGRSDWTLTRNRFRRVPRSIEPYRTTGARKLDPAKPILTVKALNKRFGSLVVATDLNLQVYPYKLHSFIGPNGAGKTTFFNMLTGILKPNAGSIVFDGHDITNLPVHKRIRLGLSRSFQILSVFPNLTAFENVRVAVQAQDRRAWGLWRDAYTYDDFNARTWSLLAAVGLEDRAADSCANLGHGQRRLLEIAISLATDAKLLLLDEPLAGLAEADREVVGTLIRKLADSHAVLLIEHDIDRVLALSDRITVLHQGRLIADGKPAEVGSNPDVVTAYLGAERIVPAARANRCRSRRARCQQADPGDRQAARRLRRQRGAGRPFPHRPRRRSRRTSRAQRRRQDHNPACHYGDSKVQQRPHHAGRREITNARPYEINQKGISLVPEGRRLFPNLTVLDNLRLAMREGGASLDDVYTLFPKLKILQRSKAESLSGGERQMLAIARALMVPAKLILLDEPFEGLAPTIVKEVMDALAQLRGRVAMVIVEHHAESVLPLVDRAYVLVNGRVAFEGAAKTLEDDHELQARLLGVVQKEAA